MRLQPSAFRRVSVLAIDGDHVTVEFLELPADACRQRLYDDRAAVQARLRRQRFSVDRQTMTLRPQPDIRYFAAMRGGRRPRLRGRGATADARRRLDGPLP